MLNVAPFFACKAQMIGQFLADNKSHVQTLAVTFSLTSVMLRTFLQRKNWTIDMPNRLLNLIVYIQLGMYGCVYRTVGAILLNFYGSWKWRHDADGRRSLRVTFMPMSRFVLYQATAMLLGWFVVGKFLSLHPHVKMPYLDGARTLSGLTMLWMLANKYVQGWWMWGLWDCIWICVCWQRGLTKLVVKYAVYLVTAAYASYRWYQEAKENAAQSA